MITIETISKLIGYNGSAPMWNETKRFVVKPEWIEIRIILAYKDKDLENLAGEVIKY